MRLLYVEREVDDVLSIEVSMIRLIMGTMQIYFRWGIHLQEMPIWKIQSSSRRK